MSAKASKYMRHVASIIFLFCLDSCWNIWASRCDERRDFLDAIARSSSYSSSNSLGSRLKSEEELIPSEDADTASDDCDDDEDAPTRLPKTIRCKKGHPLQWGLGPRDGLTCDGRYDTASTAASSASAAALSAIPPLTIPPSLALALAGTVDGLYGIRT